ncbi:hypothetical protein LCGC14_1683810 [marine sediment metagenome]|uniref:CsgH-like domain-containing protein n=1 Tax=marine sediment metagenome TaxID=412755 RepID=A0A0F9HNC8_9ZZZZ
MRMFPILLSLALINTYASATPSPEGCTLRITETGKMVMLQGVVDPQDWPQGTYEMGIMTQQGSNRSVSRQTGRFDGSNAKTTDGSLVLSTVTMYVSDGGRLAVTLQIAAGDRNQSCSFDYER